MTIILILMVQGMCVCVCIYVSVCVHVRVWSVCVWVCVSVSLCVSVWVRVSMWVNFLLPKLHPDSGSVTRFILNTYLHIVVLANLFIYSSSYYSLHRYQNSSSSSNSNSTGSSEGQINEFQDLLQRCMGVEVSDFNTKYPTLSIYSVSWKGKRSILFLLSDMFFLIWNTIVLCEVSCFNIRAVHTYHAYTCINHFINNHFSLPILIVINPFLSTCTYIHTHVRNMVGYEGIRVFGTPDNNNKNRTRLGQFSRKVTEKVKYYSLH